MFKEWATGIISIIGITLLIIANFVGVGYGLYLWGAEEYALGLAAWTAFKVWVIMIFGGILFIVIAAITQ